MSTQGGIQAGVMWTIVAGIRSFVEDRWKLEPEAIVVFTGGDGKVSSWVLHPANDVGVLPPLSIVRSCHEPTS